MKRLPWMLACLLVSLTATTLAGADPDPAIALKESARAFWNGRVNQDWAAVYSLLPADEREKTTQEAFVANAVNGPFIYVSAEVLDVETQEEIGWVNVTFTAKSRQFEMLRPRQVTQWQLWQLVEKEWRLMPADNVALVPTRPPSARPADEEAALAKRAEAYWKAMAAQDLATLYEYADPTFRATVSKEVFLSRKSINSYDDVRIDWVEVTDASGRVRASYLKKINDPAIRKQEPEPTVAVDLWVKLDGQWYRDITKEQTQKNLNRGSK